MPTLSFFPTGLVFSEQYGSEQGEGGKSTNQPPPKISPIVFWGDSFFFGGGAKLGFPGKKWKQLTKQSSAWSFFVMGVLISSYS